MKKLSNVILVVLTIVLAIALGACTPMASEDTTAESTPSINVPESTEIPTDIESDPEPAEPETPVVEETIPSEVPTETEPEEVATPEPHIEKEYPSVDYSIVWPNTQLPIFSAPDKAESIGETTPGTSYTVLSEQDGMFEVYLSAEESGWIDSNHCLINLPDYLGPLCAYDITNSYSSKYMAHEYDLPQITGTVITGYENIQLEEGKYLVPLLYPTAKILATAAQNAIDQGYRLKIYDAFRPYVATRNLYDTMVSYVYNAVPDGSTTYYNTMTQSGNYTLSSFLAKNQSKHNFGVALDLTIEVLESDTTSELPMQTAIHDLTYRSALVYNNDNANFLASIMTSAGFNTLFSEWWHFQDDASQSLYGVRLDNGLAINGWTYDGATWTLQTVN